MRDLLTAALTSHLVADPPPLSPTQWSALRFLVATEPDTADLLRQAAGKLSSADLLAVGKRLELLDEIGREVESLRTRGIQLITEFHPCYPDIWRERLQHRRPALLFVAGDPTLLSRSSVGVVGSREVDEEGDAFAAAVAREAVTRDHALVSGAARGVDQIAMRAAFDAGGTVIGFVADSLWKMAGSQQTRDMLETGRVCLASVYSPQAGFSVGNAMGRNRLIYAHSIFTVVVAASEGSGGTWAGATEAIRKRYCPVLVRDAPGGNRDLVKLGGVTVTTVADIWSVKPLTQEHAHQQTLF